MTVIKILTWNVLGSQRPDLSVVAAYLDDQNVDVVLMQEVQRRDAKKLATMLGYRWSWAFKHVPIRTRPEGACVLTRHELTNVEHVVLARHHPASWRRRIAQIATTIVDDERLVTANVHLAAHGEAGARTTQIERAWERAQRAAASYGVLPIIGGDFNDSPESPAVNALAAHGLVDSWRAHRPGENGATNWTPGPRSGRRPSQRLDYLFIPPAFEIVDVCLPGESAHEQLSRLSDHLPLTVSLAT